MTAEQLFELIAQNGYQKGTKIRLVSCNAASGPFAQNLSNMAGAQLGASAALAKAMPGERLVTSDGSKYLNIFPEK